MSEYLFIYLVSILIQSWTDRIIAYNFGQPVVFALNSNYIQSSHHSLILNNKNN